MVEIELVWLEVEEVELEVLELLEFFLLVRQGTEVVVKVAV